MQRTALVTGSSRGIGRGIAINLAQKGYNVIINYEKNEEEAEKTLFEIGKISRAIKIKADISDFIQVNELFEQSIRNFGFVDTLINNAGINSTNLLIDEPIETIKRLFDVNILGLTYVTKLFLPNMISQAFGRIVNISSMWGVSGASMESIYSSTKAAIIGLTKALSKEVCAMGVTVNAVAPGLIKTDMLNGVDEKIIDRLVSNTMAGRIGQPSDVARAVEFLCQEQSSFISGQVIGVDGEYISAN